MLPNGNWELASEKSFEYAGETAKCDRAAQAQAKSLIGQESNLAATEGAQAQQDRAQVMPFFTQEMKAEHGFTPGQSQELLTSEMSGLGGAAADTAEKARLQTARTRNASGFTKALDESARDRNKTMAGGAEAVASADVQGALAKNQAGALGLGDLNKTELSAQEKAMGLEDQSIQTELQAGQSGWLQQAGPYIQMAGNSAIMA